MAKEHPWAFRYQLIAKTRRHLKGGSIPETLLPPPALVFPSSADHSQNPLQRTWPCIKRFFAGKPPQGKVCKRCDGQNDPLPIPSGEL